jgi:phospholipid/cholesterol/gamma-HCH transport system ATP-binding protein
MSAVASRPNPGAHGGIVLRNVTFRFPGTTVLAGVDLDVPSGKTVVIRGANGSGKSTLLYICAGLLAPDSGSVAIAGRRADPHHASDLVRLGVRRGFVFQEGGLLSNMNPLANVALPLRYHADVLGIPLGDIERRATEALARAGVSESDWYTLPAHLSFGVRRRVAFARAMAIEPNYFFFDDPEVGLDPKTAVLLQDLLAELRDDAAVTTIVATNRDVLAERLGVTSYVLVNGRLVERDEVPESLPPRTA